MNSLSRAQAEAFAAMRAASGGAGFFLRRDAGSGALWASDLPRRVSAPDAAERALAGLGIRCRTVGGLWRLDWTEERFLAALKDCPTEPPPLPGDSGLHPAYALCRLMLFHPAPFPLQPLGPLRTALKLCEGPRAGVLEAVGGLHAECAARLRRGEPLAHAAGRVLARWLWEQEGCSC